MRYRIRGLGPAYGQDLSELELEVLGHQMEYFELYEDNRLIIQSDLDIDVPNQASEKDKVAGKAVQSYLQFSNRPLTSQSIF